MVRWRLCKSDEGVWYPSLDPPLIPTIHYTVLTTCEDYEVDTGPRYFTPQDLSTPARYVDAHRDRMHLSGLGHFTPSQLLLVVSVENGEGAVPDTPYKRCPTISGAQMPSVNCLG